MAEVKDEMKREKVMLVEISKIKDFPNHPFLVKDDESMEQLVNSIRMNGVLNPVIARRMDGERYELISGHRWKHARILLGMDCIPLIGREMSREEAVIEMVDSNLQREHILLSEKARAYKMKMNAMKQQGKRNGLTSTPVAGKLKERETASLIGLSNGESGDQVRRYIRLSECFSYTLNEGEYFCSPEAVMTYSDAGIGKMSRNFHRFIRHHILHPMALEPHPVVLNTWEACECDIDEAKLFQFAKEAKALGFDMLVMDDGWFGMRNNDCAGLGDWYENKNKFPNGLGNFVKRIKSEGIRFGIWVEPEMVNPDSDLYRAHPEWVLQVKGRTPLLTRNQLVLDMSNPDVLNYLKKSFDATFNCLDIDYFKWDMNRHLCHVGSSLLPDDRQGEVFFRYMKGVYRLLDWFQTRFPHAVIESCSGGGGRYDLGMMPHGIQIWTSDNTNPYDRTMIQASALLAYPAATMSCHVSDPHGDLGSLDYRYKVAVGGMLGYELNILNMSDNIKEEISTQIAQYRTFEHIVRFGDYYPLVLPNNDDYSAYYYSLPDASEILFSVIEKSDCKAQKTKALKIKAASFDVTYMEIFSGKLYSGNNLLSGLEIDLIGEPDSAHLFHFKSVTL